MIFNSRLSSLLLQFLLFYCNQQLALSRTHIKYYNKHKAKTNCWKWINVKKKKITGGLLEEKRPMIKTDSRSLRCTIDLSRCEKRFVSVMKMFFKSWSTFQTQFSDESRSLCWPERREVWARGIWCHIWYIFTLVSDCRFSVFSCTSSFGHFEIAPHKISEWEGQKFKEKKFKNIFFAKATHRSSVWQSKVQAKMKSKIWEKSCKTIRHKQTNQKAI